VNDVHSGAGATSKPDPAKRGGADPYAMMVLFLVAIGATLRLSFVWGADFPLNDGGLFMVMIRDVQANRYRLPWYTSYNAANIPFVYPPFPFYLAAALNQLLGWPILDILRLLPAALAALMAPAFLRLSRMMLPSRNMALAALAVFAFLPLSYRWLLMGGGLTRAAGALFCLLALGEAYLLYARGEARRIPWLSLWAVLTAYSHPEWAWFLCYSCALFWATWGRNRRALLHSVVVVLAVVALLAPWAGTVLARHGEALLRPLADSGSELQGRILGLVSLRWTGEALFPVLGGLALAGLLVALLERQWFWVAWVLMTFVLPSRAAGEHAAAPLALLAGMGGLALWTHLAEGEARGPRSRGLALGIVAFLALHSLAATYAGSGDWLTPLPANQRATMAWAAEHTAPDSRFLVLPEDAWYLSAASEWFPALAERPNVAVVQGYEWLGGFTQRIEQHEALRRCGLEGVACMEQWARESGASFSHIYLPMAPSAEGGVRDELHLLREALRREPGYAVVYEGAGGTVYERR